MTPNDKLRTKAIEDTFTTRRWRAEWKYRKELDALEAKKNEVYEIIGDVKRDGIVLLNHRVVVKPLFDNYEIDLYKVLKEMCESWHRPYVQCVRTSSSRIIVRMLAGAGPQRALLTPLLLVAEPIKQLKKTIKARKGPWREDAVEPDFIEDDNISYSNANIRHWVTVRSITVLFEDYGGEKAFEKWRHGILNDNMQRMLLGIGVKK